jgi:hypothetical protein
MLIYLPYPPPRHCLSVVPSPRHRRSLDGSLFVMRHRRRVGSSRTQVDSGYELQLGNLVDRHIRMGMFGPISHELLL